MKQQQRVRFRDAVTKCGLFVGKQVLSGMVHYGPAGIAGWAVKSVARKPLKFVLALVLEKIIFRCIKSLSARMADKQPDINTQ